MIEMGSESRTRPVLIAVGGGKGGVGKSVLSILIGQWLALFGKPTVVADLDLSGANVHTLLGIRDLPYTLSDLLSRRVDSLEEIVIRTGTPHLRIVCGANDDLALANPYFEQKIKIMKKLISLDAEYIILDLGAGTSFNVLDFFLLADLQITVTTAEPISMYNAYGFLRNAVFRRLSQLTRRIGELREVVHLAMDPRNPENLRTVRDLLKAVSALAGPPVVAQIAKELERIRPAVVVNRVRDERDLNAAGVIREVARKYLLMEVEDLGGVLYDRQLEKMVASMRPLTDLREGSAFEAAYHVASALLDKYPPESQRSFPAPKPAAYPLSAAQ